MTSQSFSSSFVDFPEKPSLKNIQTNNYGALPATQNEVLRGISRTHIDSFNYAMSEGLLHLVRNMEPVEFLLHKDRIRLQITNISVQKPLVSRGAVGIKDMHVYPAECRIRSTTYRGACDVTVEFSRNGVLVDNMSKCVGEIPIMVMSDKCNLTGLSPAELVNHGEETQEWGGYFICNGNEKIIRLLVAQRGNYPIGLQRNGWKKRGKLFSDYGVSVRCVRPDRTSQNLLFHYVTNGSVQVMFTLGRELFFVPVMMLLKALCNCTDYHIYKLIIAGKEKNTFFKSCVINMLRQVQDEGLLTHYDVKNYIGEKFRVKLVEVAPWKTNIETTDYLLRRCICVHLRDNEDKFHFIIQCIRKLFAVAKNEAMLESADSPMNHEITQPGDVILALLKEKLEVLLNGIRFNMERKAKSQPGSSAASEGNFRFAYQRVADITNAFNYFLATGNIVARSSIGLMQASGFTVIADKLNYWRYLSHFRCIHRGSFFTEMRTTTVRKLLPEAWGFICPVHTPDGAPCGLLNHVTAMMEVVNKQFFVSHLPQLMAQFGMRPLSDGGITRDSYEVSLDGRLLGWIPGGETAETFVRTLRSLKALRFERVPPTLEIAHVPHTGKASLYPGIFIFSSVSRMMRPVWNLECENIEWIGSLEQVHLDICVIPEEAHEGCTTHQELRDTSMLSVLANQVPWSDFNQSPRNMYQCQMGKQTMGSPMHAFRYRCDNKLYRISTPQAALVRPTSYDHYMMDEYPSGTNAIVAVISYTGYDMEDAMVLNKMSVERGFAHGVIYKTEYVNLRELVSDSSLQVTCAFGRKLGDSTAEKFVDVDGLPYIGAQLKHHDPMCTYYNLTTKKYSQVKYHNSEPGTVTEVRLLGNDTGSDTLQHVAITYCIDRTPEIGDKFASRAGQKGVCSMLWPTESMPFTESGMVPDIIFNPHGFPSRMTIGMMIELMAGKSAASHGFVHDSTPFKFSEDQPASEYYGELLRKAGYNYYGTEKMYSGVDGRELEADIFFGVVYYQRLRHMVADKYQVRATGAIDQITRQPVKGRKRGGGIRFGEMERDSLLSHGTSFLLQDRLFNCSDRATTHVCAACGSILSPLYAKPDGSMNRAWTCSICHTKEHIKVIAIPSVLKYLVAELAAINMKVKLEITERGSEDNN